MRGEVRAAQHARGARRRARARAARLPLRRRLLLPQGPQLPQEPRPPRRDTGTTRHAHRPQAEGAQTPDMATQRTLHYQERTEITETETQTQTKN